MGELASGNAPCDLAHNTTELDSRICPPGFIFDTNIDTRQFTEGKGVFQARAIDPAQNVGSSSPWVVYVDRTAPTPPSNVSIRSFDEDTRTVTISWTPGSDPLLADGSPGSGVQAFEYRAARGGGAFGDWQVTDVPEFDLDGSFLGEALQVEVSSLDEVGNASPPTSASLTVFAKTSELPWYANPSDDPETEIPLTPGEADQAVAIARADADVQAMLGGSDAAVVGIVAWTDESGGVLGAQLHLASGDAELEAVVDFGMSTVVKIHPIVGISDFSFLSVRDSISESTIESASAATLGTIAVRSTMPVNPRSNVNLRRIQRNRIAAVGEDLFWNWDFKTPKPNLNPDDLNIARTQTDWPVTVIFWGLVDVDTAKDIWNRGQDKASSQHGRVRDAPNDAQPGDHADQYSRPVSDADQGTFRGLPFCSGRKNHYRVYAPGPEARYGATHGLDQMWNRAWGYYVVATTHIDNHEKCPEFVPDKLGGDPYTGNSEAVEHLIALEAPKHKRQVKLAGPCWDPLIREEPDPWNLLNPVSGQRGEDTLNLYNRDMRGRVKRDGPDLVFLNDGLATMIHVPRISHPVEDCIPPFPF